MAGIKVLPGETKAEYWKRVDSIIESMDCLDTRNGQVIARYPSKYRVVPFAADVLTGILKEDYDIDEARDEYFKEKYALAD